MFTFGAMKVVGCSHCGVPVMKAGYCRGCRAAYQKARRYFVSGGYRPRKVLVGIAGEIYDRVFKHREKP